MLDIEKLNDISYTNKVISMYEELNTELTKDILKRISETREFNSYTKTQLRSLARRGGTDIFFDVLRKVNSLSSSRKKELINLFSGIINDDLSDYKDLYEYRDIDFKLSKSQLSILNRMVKLTDSELSNYTKTIAFSCKKEYVNAIDKMYQQIVTGGMDFNTAFRYTTNDLVDKGITLPMANGKSRSIEASVRQNVMYGLRKTSQMINDDLIDYLEADAVQINISHNCRDSHIPINGMIFSLDKNKKEYPCFTEELSSLMEEYNCQHYKSPFIIGVSEPVYTKTEISDANNKLIFYNGKYIRYYKATQMQRSIEREIRNTKKKYLNSNDLKDKMKVEKCWKKMRDFINQTGLTRHYDREYYAGYNIVNPVDLKLMIANKNNKSLFNDNIITRDFKKMNKEVESMIIYNKNTRKQIYKCSNNQKSSVGDLKSATIFATSKKNSIVTAHNHPTNSSFSLQDMVTFNRFKSIDSLFVETEKYTYYLTKNDINKVKSKYLNKMITDIRNIYYNKYGKTKEALHLANIEISERIGWKYGRYKK